MTTLVASADATGGAFRIETPRFHLRELTSADVSDRYLAWLGDAQAQKYITTAATTTRDEDLRRYVAERTGRADVLFLGIFERATGLHIGNIKYEPVDSVNGFAVMGVLIGDGGYRGKGVTPEVLEASARWLQARRGIRQILLGVSADNQAAIRAYEKVGFSMAPTRWLPNLPPGTVSMVWLL